jgi:hypothetical protein
MAKGAATAWGEATVVDELVLPQRSGAKRFASVVQLLAGPDGERYVRFAYTTDGTARRGPVTLRETDVDLLRRRLDEHPELAKMLSLGSAERRGGDRSRSSASG